MMRLIIVLCTKEITGSEALQPQTLSSQLRKKVKTHNALSEVNIINFLKNICMYVCC